METEEKRIIEINGVKFEIDLCTATRVDKFAIGTQVKVLEKDYGDQCRSYPGVIVGFDNFIEHPNILVAYLEASYSEVKMKFLDYNKDTKGFEIAPLDYNTQLFEKKNIIQQFDSELRKKELEIEEIIKKKTYFLEHFNKYFELPIK